jgi:glycosyltransferase involved in cell wall biosynthesis|tara:strand:+ start:1917 stop:2543 length:627 start_codon:yes stop_codon:yes gene_type:complete
MKNKSPDVSVIITNYNYGKYVTRAVRSCLAQKHINVEVVVVDDCSDDNSLETLSTFKDDINLIVNKKNVGVAESSNVGIRAAKAQFVIRVDADDFINSDTCYIMKRYLVDNHDAFCVSCDYILVDDHENLIERKYAEKDNISCGIMYRRDLLIESGGYNSDMRHKEEEELRKRLGSFYKIHHLRMPFYRYRMHNTNKTKQPEYKEWKI